MFNSVRLLPLCPPPATPCSSTANFTLNNNNNNNNYNHGANKNNHLNHQAANPPPPPAATASSAFGNDNDNERLAQHPTPIPFRSFFSSFVVVPQAG